MDGLRAMAIIVVIGFHAFPDWLSGGFIGVDIFFVISGYLITQVLVQQSQRQDFSLGKFYAGRIRRLFPALIVVLSACYIVGWVALLADEYQRLGKLTLAGAAFLSNLVLWRETGYFDYAAGAKPLLHLWSLGIEGQFYLLWPVILLMTLKSGRSVVRLSVMLLLISLVLNVFIAPQSPTHAFFSPATRLWEFFAGCLIAKLPPLTWERLPFANLILGHTSVSYTAISATGLMLITTSVIFFDRDLAFPGVWAVVPVLGTVLIIMAGERSWINQKLFSHRLLVDIGLISYPLYLWHWPILSFAKIMTGKPLSWELQAALLAAAVCLSIMTYHGIERPLRNGQSLRKKTGMLAMGMIALGLAGLLAFMKDGFPHRYQNRVVASQMADLQFDLPETPLWYCADTRPDGPRCHATGPNPTVVVMGDSHALTIYSGLMKRFTSQGQDIALYGASDGCPPLLNVVIQDLGGDARNCIARGSDAIRRIVSDPTIQQVILTSRGPMYTTAEGFGEIEQEQFGSWALNLKDEPRGLRSNEEVFSIGLANTLDALLSAGKTITFLHDVPELGFDIRSCFSFRPLVINASVRHPCAVSKSAFEERTMAYRLMVNRILAQRPTVRVIDLAEALCDENHCLGAKEGVLFYMDDDHLSHRGADYVVKQLWNRF